MTTVTEVEAGVLGQVGLPAALPNPGQAVVLRLRVR
jgi:hypothetical protein